MYRRCAVIIEGHDAKSWQQRAIAGVRALGCMVDAGSLATIQRGAQSYDCAFDLRLAGEPPELGLARCWWLQIGEAGGLSAPLFFDEIASETNIVQARLLRRTSEIERTVARVGTFELRGTAKRTLTAILEEVAYWPASVLQAGEFPASIAAHRPHEAPAPAKRVRFAMNSIRRILLKIGSRFVREDWNIGIIDARPEQFLDPNFRPQPRWLHWDDAARGRDFFADPFITDNGESASILCEHFDDRIGKGQIVACEVQKNGAARWTPAIARPFHLSYPYIVTDEQRVYCIPESFSANRVDLYELVGAQWEYAATLIDGIDACDSTVVRFGDRWWLFCTRQSRLPLINLYVFYADRLAGPWIPHLLNPVKTDVRSARPAGHPFVHRGELYRPAQDCSRTYGGALAITHVRRLSESDFEEEVVRVIAPDRSSPYPDGIHTLSHWGNVCAIDGRRDVFDPLVRLRRRGG